MSTNKKRRHHYVWRGYLRAWAIDEKIYCLRNNKIINPNLMGVAVQKDFYKLNELSNDDIEFIRNHIIKISPKESRRCHENLLNAFTYAHWLFKKYPEIKSSKNPEVKEAVDLYLHNLEEDLQTGIESIGEKYLEYLHNKDVAFFETDKGFMDFIYYLCVQYMRTKKMREFNIKAFRSTPHQNAINKSWNILSHILATNMGGSLYIDRKNFKLMMIENDTKNDFITGDQPVINIFSLSTIKDEPIENIAFYYPISPKLAVFVIEKNRFEGMTVVSVTEQEVDSYNKAIIQCSFEQVFSLKRDTLEQILNNNTFD
jgi:hypothetical protein